MGHTEATKQKISLTKTGLILTPDERVERCKHRNRVNAKRWRLANPARNNANARNWRKNNPRKALCIDMKRAYLITWEQFLQKIVEQNGLCAACKKPLDLSFITDVKRKRPAIDHDHDCCQNTPTCGNCIRGIVHDGCNGAMGLVNDDPQALRNLAEYLENKQRWGKV